MPAPEAPLLPPPGWPPIPTTDLQGNLAASAALAPSLPLPAPETDIQPDIADHLPAAEKGTRGLKIFGIITLLIILSTIALGTFFFWPKLQKALESNRLNEAREFEHVLVNLLQVENQENRGQAD